jgi:NPCBM/NEW2 domain
MEAAWGGRRPERELIARDDGHPMARDGPERPEGCQGRPVLPDGEDATLPRLRHDGLGGPMQRGRTLFWTIIGSVVAAVAIVITLIQVNSGTPPKAAYSPVPPISASASSQAGESAPVVIPKTSSTSSFSYLSDLKPSGNLAQLVNRRPVKIDGSIYPKSILFYCNVGDPTAFPAYKLKHNARRFQATIGLEAKFPPHFEAGIILVGDGRTLRTFSVSVLRPKTVDVNVTGVHTLQLECFGSGQSSSAGWAIAAAWGNARVTEGH